jgi:hypothetical protein
MKLLLLILALVPAVLLAQSRKQKKAVALQKKADLQVISNLKNHVQYLISNSSEKDAALKGEENTTSYIANQFKLIGLQPKGSNGFVQQFKLDLGKQIDTATFLKVNGTDLQINKEYVPLAYSAEKRVTGMPAMALRERGVPWFADAKDWAREDTKNPAYNVDEILQTEVAKVAAKGATALFVYNSSNIADSVRFNKRDKTSPSPIPVVYITRDGYKKYFGDHEQMLDIEMNIAFKETEKNGKNVVGYIDNGATSAIIIGASYDKSGAANDNTTAETASVANTGNNATRTAMLIELARMLVASPAKNNNYVFIAFSSEDNESQGSKFWLQNTTITAVPNYMVNLDNVDVTDEDNKLFIGGYKSSAKLAGTIAASSGKDLQVNLDSLTPLSGTFHSFYQKNIPVLNVYTASKDHAIQPVSEDKINYEGELRIARFISRLIEATNAQGKLAFSKIVPAEMLAETAEQVRLQ